jgi:hypothetical protein
MDMSITFENAIRQTQDLLSQIEFLDTDTITQKLTDVARDRAKVIEFQQEISTFIQPEQEGVMQITTSWMRCGLEQGLEQGLARERNLIVRLIKRKLGAINVDIESRIITLNIDDLERVGEALLDFSTVEDLTNWLNALDA